MREQGNWPYPDDEFPVFDDRFVARGVPESRLRRPSVPPPVTPLGLGPVGPRDWVPVPPEPYRPQRSHPVLLALALVAVVVAVVGTGVVLVSRSERSAFRSGAGALPRLGQPTNAAGTRSAKASPTRHARSAARRPSAVSAPTELPPASSPAVPPVAPPANAVGQAPRTVTDFTAVGPDPVVVTGVLQVDQPTTYVCLSLRLANGDTTVITTGNDDYSWKASTDADNRPENALSGIVTGANPYTGRMLRHAGQAATLVGLITPEDPRRNCGHPTIFVVTGVR